MEKPFYEATPEYDILNGKVFDDKGDDLPNMGLNDGLFEDEFPLPEPLAMTGWETTGGHFIFLAQTLSLDVNMVETTLNDIYDKTRNVEELIKRSFLPEPLKARYITSFQNKLRRYEFNFPRRSERDYDNNEDKSSTGTPFETISETDDSGRQQVSETQVINDTQENLAGTTISSVVVTSSGPCLKCNNPIGTGLKKYCEAHNKRRNRCSR